MSSYPKPRGVPLSPGSVHETNPTSGTKKLWRNKPLVHRASGDRIFKTGVEASQILIEEAEIMDPGAAEFLASWESVVSSLAVVFDRMPKYAWVMKQLIEPERSITFRVAWMDDHGISRVNRGFRVQYCSAHGPYEGGLTFGPNVNHSFCKAAAFDTVFRNALSQKHIGGAYGGSDFDPSDASESETERFCQSFMTELSKYIGPDLDLPGIGDGVTATEIGFMYGQYKRINDNYGQYGSGLLWGGAPAYTPAIGSGVVHLAKKLLDDKGIDLAGKRCLITGSQNVASSVASKLLEYGAVPITFSDKGGYIYEADGFDLAKMRTVQMIQADRGASIGRYIVSSTTAKYNATGIFDIPCDLVFPCSEAPLLDETAVDKLVAGGCKAIIEGVHHGITNPGLAAAKKKGLLHIPYRASLMGASLINGYTMAKEPLLPGQTMDNRVEVAMGGLYEELKATAKEFNTRGDLSAAANIAAFLKVADVMLAHGHV